MLINILITILYYSSFLICLVFLFFLLKQPKLSEQAKILITLIAWTALWTGLTIIAPLNIFSENIHVFLWRLVFVSSNLVTITLFKFVLFFNDAFNKVSKYFYLFLFWVLIVPINIILLFTDLLVRARIPERMMWEVGYVEGGLYSLSALLISSGILLAFIFSLYFFVKCKDRILKKQLKLVLLSTVFPLFIGVTTNLILPILGITFPRLASISTMAVNSILYYVIYEYSGLNIKTKRYSIRTRLVVYFLIINFITLSSGFVIYFNVSSKSLTKQIETHLIESVTEKALVVNNYLVRQTQKLALLSQHGGSYSNVLKVEKSDPSYTANLLNAKDRLVNSLDVDFKNISITDINGQVLVSTHEEFSEKNFSSHLDYSQNDTFFSNSFLDLNTGEQIFYISHPIFSMEKIKIGFLLVQLNTESLYNNFIDSYELEKGDTYIINKNGYLISPIKGNKEAILINKIKNDPVIQCLEYINNTSKDKIKVGKIYNYKNEQDIDTMASFATIPTKEWCVVNEMDKQYFLTNSLQELADVFYYILGLASLLTILLSYFFSRTFSKPITLLQQGAKEITKGNLDYITEVGVRDEFAELAEAFNLMSSELKKSYFILEEKVRERTDELQVALSSISDSRKAVLNILEDVEEEKEKVGKEKDKINAILHSIGDAVLVIDDEYRVIMINKIVEEVSGFSSQDLVGKKYFDILKFVTEKEGKEVRNFVELTMKNGEIRKMDRHTMLIRKNGSKVAVADSSSPLRDKNGQIIGCVVVFRDVTTESQIDQAKTEFVSLASHQLRTPLSTIGWYAEMMLAGDAGKINQEQRQYLDEIYKGNKRMVDLVNALLNVSRLELGTFSIEPENIYLKDIAESVLNELKPQVVNKKMLVTKFYDENLVKNYSADPKLTRIIFQNLLSNAVKYTPDGGKIDLSIKVVKKEILITVSDNGLGIPDNQRGLIFSKLFRADNVKETDTEGTGLGLYIIKSIVENIGGKIWFESPSVIVNDNKVKNRGTSFYLSLPLEGMKKKAGAKTLS